MTEYQSVGGPLDGLKVYFDGKPPKHFEFHCRGCKRTGFFVAVYRYEPADESYRYDSSFNESLNIPHQCDVVATEWMELKGSPKTGGGRWMVWQPIN